MMKEELADSKLLLEVVAGDIDAMEELLHRPWDRIEARRDSLPELVVKRQAVARILTALHKGVSPLLIQQWASFVRRGFHGQINRIGGVAPIKISYELCDEDRIVAVVSRLDELGDFIDGEISDAELALMLEDMTSAD